MAGIRFGKFWPAWLAPKFPRFFKQSYEPLFFDARLSFAEEIEKWRVQSIVSLQLVTNVLLLSLLAVMSMVRSLNVIPGRRESDEPGISRFPDAQLRIWGLVLRTIPE